MPEDAEVLSCRAKIQAQVYSLQSPAVYEVSTLLINGIPYPKPPRSPTVVGQ